MKILFSEQSIEMVEPWLPRTIMLFIGIIFLLLAFIFWKNLQQHKLQWIVGGFGILFILGGLLLLFTKLKTNIHITNKGISISEKKFRYSENLQFNWTDIQQLEILPSVYNQSAPTKSNENNAKIQLEVNIRFNNGSLLFLETFANSQKATQFIQKIHNINSLKTVLLLPENYEKNQTFQSIVNALSSVNPIIYTNPDSIFLNSKNTSPIILTENSQSITTSGEGKSTHLYWSGRKSSIPFILFTLLAITFLFIIFKVVVPSKGYNILTVIGIFVGFIITLVSLLSLIFSIGGKYHLILQEKELICKSEWFGKPINKQQIAYSNILHIRNSFNSSASSDLILLTPKGYNNLIKPIFREYAAPNFNMLLNTVMNYKDNMLIINTYGLGIKDKLFLENKIRERLQNQ